MLCGARVNRLLPSRTSVCVATSLIPERNSAQTLGLRSHSRDNLDPGLVHCLEPLSLHLGILVRDGADRVVPPAVDDLVGMWSDDDLVDQHLGQCAPINSR